MTGWVPLPAIQYTTPADNAPQGASKIDLSFTAINNIKQDYVDPRDWTGYDNTGTNPMDTILNAAIQQAIASYVPLRIPAGVFLCESTLICNLAGTTSGHSSVWIEGVGPAQAALSILTPQTARTMLVAAFNNLPLLSLNAVSGGIIRYLGLFGQNSAPGNMAPSNSPGYPIDTQSLYVSAGCRNAQYSPYCGIAIDAFNVAVAPADGGYPGLPYNQNTNLGSDNILIDQCALGQFVVGIACSLSGIAPAGDNLAFKNVNMQVMDTCYALASPNSHRVVIERGTWSYFREGVNGVSWGGSKGSPPQIRDMQINWGYRTFNVDNASGAMTLDNCYAESMRTIGQFGGGSSTLRSSFSILGGTYYINQLWGTAGQVNPPPLWLECWGPGKAIGTEFFPSNPNNLQFPAFNIAGGGNSPFELDHCTLPAGSVNYVPPACGIAYNSNYMTVRMQDCWVGMTGGFYLSDEGYRAVSLASYTPITGRFVGTYQANRYAVGNAVYQYLPATNQGFLSVGGISAMAKASSTVQFTYSGALLLANDILLWKMIAQGTSISQMILPALQLPPNAAATGCSISATTLTIGTLSSGTLVVGQFVIGAGVTAGTTITANISGSGSGSTWVVSASQSVSSESMTFSAISGTSVTANMLFDPIEYDSVANQLSSTSVNLVQNQWAPTQALTCTTDGTTAVITSVAPVTILQNGDFVIGVGLAANSRVVSGGGTATVTLNQNTTAGASGVALYYGRLYTPTLTAAW